MDKKKVSIIDLNDQFNAICESVSDSDRKARIEYSRKNMLEADDDDDNVNYESDDPEFDPSSAMQEVDVPEDEKEDANDVGFDPKSITLTDYEKSQIIETLKSVLEKVDGKDISDPALEEIIDKVANQHCALTEEEEETLNGDNADEFAYRKAKIDAIKDFIVETLNAAEQSETGEIEDSTEGDSDENSDESEDEDEDKDSDEDKDEDEDEDKNLDESEDDEDEDEDKNLDESEDDEDEDEDLSLDDEKDSSDEDKDSDEDEDDEEETEDDEEDTSEEKDAENIGKQYYQEHVEDGDEDADSIAEDQSKLPEGVEEQFNNANININKDTIKEFWEGFTGIDNDDDGDESDEAREESDDMENEVVDDATLQEVADVDDEDIVDVIDDNDPRVIPLDGTDDEINSDEYVCDQDSCDNDEEAVPLLIKLVKKLLNKLSPEETTDFDNDVPVKEYDCSNNPPEYDTYTANDVSMALGGLMEALAESKGDAKKTAKDIKTESYDEVISSLKAILSKISKGGEGKDGSKNSKPKFDDPNIKTTRSNLNLDAINKPKGDAKLPTPSTGTKTTVSADRKKLANIVAAALLGDSSLAESDRDMLNSHSRSFLLEAKDAINKYNSSRDVE